MCQVKVKVRVKGQIINKQYYTLCCVRSITPLLMEGFSSNLNYTFTSTMECAEPMMLMCQVKVKVRVKGQIFNKQYYTLCRVRSITLLIKWTSTLHTAYASLFGLPFTASQYCFGKVFPVWNVPAFCFIHADCPNGDGNQSSFGRFRYYYVNYRRASKMMCIANRRTPYFTECRSLSLNTSLKRLKNT